jgi:hypothetical protein
MIDILGTLYTPGTYGTNGQTMTVITEPVALPGYHVNTLEPVEGWDAYLVVPTLPRRVFAGAATTCYKFPSESEFLLARTAAGLDPLPLRDAKIQNQGWFGSCVGQSISGIGEVALGARGKFIELSPMFVYYNARKAASVHLNKPIEDGGTSVFLALGIATKQGIAREDLWPEGTDPLLEPSAIAYADGATRKVGRYEAVGLDTTTMHRNRLNDIHVALACRMGVVFAIPLRRAFYDIRGPLAIHGLMYPTPAVGTSDPDFIGYHAMHIVGIDLDAGYLIVENSWGAEWGDGGHWAMPLRALYSCFELFAMREFAGERFEIPETLRIRKNPIESNYGRAYRLYRAAFGRTPDAGGLAFWVTALDNSYTLQQIAAGFIDSAEFRARYGDAPTDAEFAASLYANILYRTPDPTGHQFWLDRLADGVPRADVLAAVSESAENKQGALW